MMRGLIQHFRLTLLLNFKSRQALIYGYLVPVFFLIAFGSIFRGGQPPLLGELGQLLTISVLGGACFGMPTALVAERDRGIWRRYRLLPVRAGWLLASTMAARVIIIVSAAALQIFLAWLMYGMPMPVHPGQMAGAFLLVTFAFLGMGLIIAMLADSVPAVQALGQAIFLPMIMIGGVGVPLWTLPRWAQHLACYLPGKYAVEALQACAAGDGLLAVWFDMPALLVIGGSAVIAGALMFRWDAQEKVAPGRRGWVLLALGAWVVVGAAGDLAGVPNRLGRDEARPAGYESVTQSQIDAVTYDNLPADNDNVTPLAHNLDALDDRAQARMAEFARALEAWPPGRVDDPVRQVRNLLQAASVADLDRNSYEGEIAFVVFQKLRRDFGKPELEQILTWIILHSDDDKAITSIEELGVHGDALRGDVNDRVPMYARKLLGRLTGKITALP